MRSLSVAISSLADWEASSVFAETRSLSARTSSLVALSFLALMASTTPTLAAASARIDQGAERELRIAELRSS